MRALVTGSTGCLGRNLVQRLLVQGHDVTASGRNKAIGKTLSDKGARFVRADLEDAGAIAKTCLGQDVVFHCGGLSSPWGPWAAFESANVRGTKNVTQGCLAAGVQRLVHISSPAIYFDFKSRRGIPEDTCLPDRPANNYAKSKRMAEAIVKDACADGLSTVTIRPRGIFGPHDTALFPRLMRVAERGWVPLFDAGKATIDLTYVENVVDALLAAGIASEKVSGKKYNITNGQPVTVAEFLRNVFDVMGVATKFRSIPYSVGLAAATSSEMIALLRGGHREPKITRYAVGLLSKDQTLDISAAKNDLAYTPQVSIDSGLAAFSEWWHRHD